MTQDVTEEAPRLVDPDLKVELRGYELCRRVLQSNGGGKEQTERWAQVAAYRPNQYGWNEARKSASYLSEKHPKEVYRIRVIISMEPPPREVIAAQSAGGEAPTPVPETVREDAVLPPIADADAAAAAALGIT